MLHYDSSTWSTQLLFVRRSLTKQTRNPIQINKSWRPPVAWAGCCYCRVLLSVHTSVCDRSLKGRKSILYEDIIEEVLVAAVRCCRDTVRKTNNQPNLWFNMANKSEEAKGVGKDVIKQSESVHALYDLVDLKGGGRLVEGFRRSQARKDSSHLDNVLDTEMRRFLYNGGQGKDIPISNLVLWRKQSRSSQSKSVTSKKKSWSSCCGKSSNTIESVMSEPSYALNETQGTSFVCWLYQPIQHMLVY